MNSIYEFNCKNAQSETVSLGKYANKVLLIVNTASKCGFTPQYEGLNNLHLKYREKDFSVLGFPCNQFGNQEPGDENAISEFCEVNYGVTFTITEKIDVKGNNQHELYKWLTQARKNGYKNSSVKWNFQKYLVNPKGELVDYFYSMTSPKSSKITTYLK